MINKIFILVAFFSSFVLADEVVVKATGDFAKELQALVEKYQNSSINGTIEVTKNTNETNQTTLTKEERIKLSPIEQAMQEQITLDSDNETNETEKYNRYFSDEKQNPKSSNLVNILLEGSPVEGEVAKGKKLYEAQCAKCHGDRAEKSTYTSARDLNTLSKDEIYEQLRNYNRDGGYGSNVGFIMRNEAIRLDDSQMRDAAEYIQSLKAAK